MQLADAVDRRSHSEAEKRLGSGYKLEVRSTQVPNRMREDPSAV